MEKYEALEMEVIVFEAEDVIYNSDLDTRDYNGGSGTTP